MKALLDLVKNRIMPKADAGGDENEEGMEDMETQAGPSSSSQPPHKCTHPTTAAATAATAPCDETDMQRTNTPPPHQDTNASASPAHHHHSEDNRPLHGPMGDSNKSIHIDGEGGHNPDPFPLMDLADSVFHLVLKRLQESPNVNDSISWEFERRRCQPHATADIGRLCFASPSMLFRVLAAEIPPFVIWGKTKDAVRWLSVHRSDEFNMICTKGNCYFDVNLGAREEMGPSLEELHTMVDHVRSIKVRVPATAIDLLVRFRELRDLTLLKCGGLLSDDHLRAFSSNLTKLKRLTIDLECNHDGKLPGPLEGHQISDSGISALGRLKDLEELGISMHPDPYSLDPKSQPTQGETFRGPSRFIEHQLVTEAGLVEMLQPLRSLTVLELRFFKGLDDSVLRVIAQCTMLRYLDLADCPALGAEGCEALAQGLTRLEHLNVSLWGDWTVDVKRRSQPIMQYLGKLPKLTRLDTSGISDMIHTERLAHLAPLSSSLHHLNLTHAEVLGAMLNPLSTLSNLKSLAVMSSVREDTHNELDLVCLREMRNLEQLELGGIDAITPGSRPYLTQLTALKVFSLSFMSYTLAEDLLLTDVTGLKNLRSLTLETIPIEDTAFAALPFLTSLIRLVIVDCPITDSAIDYIVQLPQLAMLCLECCNVTDTGLANLRHLTSLEYLEVRLLTNFQIHSIEHFKGLSKLYYIGVEMRHQDACEHVDEVVEAFRAQNVTVEVDFTDVPRLTHQFMHELMMLDGANGDHVHAHITGLFLVHPDDFQAGMIQGLTVPPGGVGVGLEVTGPEGVQPTMIPVGVLDAPNVALINGVMPVPGAMTPLSMFQWDQLVQLGLPIPPLQPHPGAGMENGGVWPVIGIPFEMMNLFGNMNPDDEDDEDEEEDAMEM